MEQIEPSSTFPASQINKMFQKKSCGQICQHIKIFKEKLSKKTSSDFLRYVAKHGLTVYIDCLICILLYIIFKKMYKTKFRQWDLRPLSNKMVTWGHPHIYIDLTSYSVGSEALGDGYETALLHLVTLWFSLEFLDKRWSCALKSCRADWGHVARYWISLAFVQS